MMKQQDLFVAALTNAPMIHVLFVMLNPSKADAHIDDHTITKCIGFTSRWAGATSEMSMSARTSPCGKYRYVLERRTSLWSFAVVNFFAWRETHSAELKRRAAEGVDIVGPENDDAIVAEAARADRIVLAHGAAVSFGPRAPAIIRERPARMLELLRSYDLWCLWTAEGGAPRHPLMLGYDTPLVRFGAL